ncbi:hypothetical protein HDV00_004823 [Rhizophlyctis rosea]|nr:hypothetical protein HDV00_004823 [Rhizophlyctis rosea]
MEVRCTLEDAKSVATNGDVEESEVMLGDQVVKIYRFEWEWPPCKGKSIQVIGLDINAWVCIFGTGQQGKGKGLCKLDRWKGWLEDKISDPYLASLTIFALNEIRLSGATHYICNEATSLKIITSNPTPPSYARIFLCHAYEHLPFGPYASHTGFLSSPPDLARLHQIEGIWTVSKALEQYIRHYDEGLKDVVTLPNHPFVYATDQGEWDSIPFHDNFDTGKIAAINPGVVKGWPVLKRVVEEMPDVEFLAVKSWAVSEGVEREIGMLKNLELVPSTKDMSIYWPQIKILLVPSVWQEAFGLVVVEAMLRGIPVISSDTGGLPESHLSIPYVLPVTPITGARETHPHQHQLFGEYKVPIQDEAHIKSWVQTIRSLVNDRETYEAIRQAGRAKSLEYCKGVDLPGYEQWFHELTAKLEMNQGEGLGR